jgi:hypothetical protein
MAVMMDCEDADSVAADTAQAAPSAATANATVQEVVVKIFKAGPPGEDRALYRAGGRDDIGAEVT